MVIINHDSFLRLQSYQPGNLQHAYTAGNPFVNLIATPQFGTSNCSVILGWNADDRVSYEAITVPETIIVLFLKRTRLQLILFYNTLYNITIAATLCGQNSERVTTTVMLSYGELA